MDDGTRRARAEDIPELQVLLAASGLPPLPHDFPVSRVWVVEEQGTLVGAIALELTGRRALLRSAVVREANRGRGAGERLVGRLVKEAHGFGLTDVYLLTETASTFFARHGFETVQRENVPEEIRLTEEYAKQCPDSAAVMRRVLIRSN